MEQVEMPERLSERVIARARKIAAGREVMVTDADVPSLHIRIHPSGYASFVFRYRQRGRVYKTTLGRVGNLTLTDARKTAKIYAGRIADGRDPIAEKIAEDRRHSDALDAARRAKAENASTGQFTAGTMIRKWAAGRKDDRRSPRYVVGIRNALERTLASVLDLPARDLGKDRIQDLIEAAEKERGPAAARQALMALRLAFKRALKDGRLETNPCIALEAPRLEARTRTLAGREIRRIWRATGALPSPAGNYIRFLLATGVRRNEALEARWLEIEGDRWTIPKERMKAGREFIVPLTNAARAALPARGDSDFIFSNGVRPIGGLGRVKAKLDALVEADGGGPLVTWVFHDIRRTLASWLAENGVDYVIADLCLAHLPPLNRVGLIYQRSYKLAERRQALELWGAFLDPESATAPALRLVSST
jgi:integrase